MRAFLDLIFPASCVGCQRPSVIACATCLAPLSAMPRPAWPRPSPPGLPPPFAVAPYDGSVRRLLLAFKEEGVAGLRPPLGRALATAVVSAIGALDGVRLVPVPSSAKSRRERGEDVVRLLAETAARDLRRIGLDATAVPALRHSRRVRDSAGLTSAERAANLADAFVARPVRVDAIASRPVVLVDDLVTTGATLAECAAALRLQGIDVLACATVAATQRRLIASDR
jgi:predicted amidophosphoribosyltransferase